MYDFKARKALHASEFLNNIDDGKLGGNRRKLDPLVLGAVSHTVETIFFHANLAKNTGETILEFGPIKLTAECRRREAAIRLFIEANGSDLFIFGDIDDDA
jgi:hypothetical protein